VIELANVTKVLPRNYQSVARVKLPTIQKSHGEIVLPDDAGQLRARTISQKTHAALMSLSRESNGEVEGPDDHAG